MTTERDFGFAEFDLDPDTWHDGLDDAAVRWVQHLAVLEVRREMAAHATSRAAVAGRLGVSEGQLGRKLAGTSAITFEDAVRLAIAFGPSVLPRFDELSELLPPSFRGSFQVERRHGMAVLRAPDG